MLRRQYSITNQTSVLPNHAAAAVGGTGVNQQQQQDSEDNSIYYISPEKRKESTAQHNTRQRQAEQVVQENRRINLSPIAPLQNNRRQIEVAEQPIYRSAAKSQDQYKSEAFRERFKGKIQLIDKEGHFGVVKKSQVPIEKEYIRVKQHNEYSSPTPDYKVVNNISQQQPEEDPDGQVITHSAQSSPIRTKLIPQTEQKKHYFFDEERPKNVMNPTNSYMPNSNPKLATQNQMLNKIILKPQGASQNFQKRHQFQPSQYVVGQIQQPTPFAYGYPNAQNMQVVDESAFQINQRRNSKSASTAQQQAGHILLSNRAAEMFMINQRSSAYNNNGVNSLPQQNFVACEQLPHLPFQRSSGLIDNMHQTAPFMQQQSSIPINSFNPYYQSQALPNPTVQQPVNGSYNMIPAVLTTTTSTITAYPQALHHYYHHHHIHPPPLIPQMSQLHHPGAPISQTSNTHQQQPFQQSDVFPGLGHNTLAQGTNSNSNQGLVVNFRQKLEEIKQKTNQKNDGRVSRNQLEAISKRGGTMPEYESERADDKISGIVVAQHQKRLQASKVQIKSSNINHGNRHEKHSMQIISQNGISNSSQYKMDVAVKSSRNMEQYVDHQQPSFNRIFMDPKEGFSMKPKAEYNEALKRASILNQDSRNAAMRHQSQRIVSHVENSLSQKGNHNSVNIYMTQNDITIQNQNKSDQKRLTKYVPETSFIKLTPILVDDHPDCKNSIDVSDFKESIDALSKDEGGFKSAEMNSTPIRTSSILRQKMVSIKKSISQIHGFVNMPQRKTAMGINNEPIMIDDEENSFNDINDNRIQSIIMNHQTEQKPIKFIDFTQQNPGKYYKLGGLGPSNIGTQDWLKGKERQRNINEYVGNRLQKTANQEIELIDQPQFQRKESQSRNFPINIKHRSAIIEKSPEYSSL